MSDKPINADELTEPVVFCVISGGESGWFHVYVRTSAKTCAEAAKCADSFLTSIFPGRHKVVREKASADESMDFEHGFRVVSGYCRFSFSSEDGPTEDIQKEFESGLRYVSWGR